MKIFSAEQLAKADKATLKHQGISSLDLMERAAGLAFSTIQAHYEEKRSFLVFCGIGNNGGDGLVIARKLLERGHDVHVFIVEYSSYYSVEFEANYKRLTEKHVGIIQKLKQGDDFPKIEQDDILIDAIFGVGLNRPLPNWICDLVHHLNKTEVFVWGVDMPTGLYTDKPPHFEDILKADITLTFQHPKLSFFLPETSEYAGEVKILDIGLDQDFIKSLPAQYSVLEKGEIKALLKERNKFSHKGTFGHVLVVGGSRGMMGSMILATRAALRSGVGKTTALIPRCGYEIMQIAVPEAMVLTSLGKERLKDFYNLDFTPEAVCFGTGARNSHEVARFLKELMNSYQKPMVIDADGLNLLVKHQEILEKIPKDSILTPHPGELWRLIGGWKDDFEKMEKAQDFAQKYHIVLLIKGFHTQIITGEKTYINPTGNSGMATAGSGDVLAGLISGLLAQGYPSDQAALLGVYIHGLAGDFVLEESSQEALIAGDLIANFGRAFRSVSIE